MVEQLGRIADERPDLGAEYGILLADSLKIDGVLHLQGFGELLLVLGKTAIQCFETYRIDQVGHPDTTPANLVLIRGADAARRGANGPTNSALGDFLDGTMER